MNMDIKIYSSNERPEILHNNTIPDKKQMVEPQVMVVERTIIRSPIKEKKTITSLAIKPSLLCNAKDLCKQRGISFSKLIEELLTENIL